MPACVLACWTYMPTRENRSGLAGCNGLQWLPAASSSRKAADLLWASGTWDRWDRQLRRFALLRSSSCSRCSALARAKGLMTGSRL